MANPRANPLYEGTLDPASLTFKYDGTIVYDPSFYNQGYHSAQLATPIAAGKPTPAVQLNGASGGQVGIGGAVAGELAGRLENVEADVCGVTVRGVVGFSYLGGAVPLVGKAVISDGNGNVAPIGASGLRGRGQVVALDTVNLIAYVNILGG